jgi:hypothetical protein
LAHGLIAKTAVFWQIMHFAAATSALITPYCVWQAFCLAKQALIGYTAG